MATPSRPRIALALAAAIAAGLATTSLAVPRIVPGQRIGPVSAGAERATVEGAIGPGVVIGRVPSAVAPGNRNLDAVSVAYPAWAVVAQYLTDEASAPVTRIATRSPRYRTPAGLGVGSARAAIRAAHRRAACTPTACRVGRRMPESVVTRFTLTADRVTRVELVRLPPTP